MIEEDLKKKQKELLNIANDIANTMFKLYEYSKYPEFREKEPSFYSKEDIIEMKKLYMINRFYEICSFKKFKNVIKDISIRTFQSPFTVISSICKIKDK